MWAKKELWDINLQLQEKKSKLWDINCEKKRQNCERKSRNFLFIFWSRVWNQLPYCCFQTESRQTFSGVIRGARLTAESILDAHACVCVCVCFCFCGVLVWLMLLVTSESEVPICVWVKELERLVVQREIAHEYEKSCTRQPLSYMKKVIIYEERRFVQTVWKNKNNKKIFIEMSIWELIL